MHITAKPTSFQCNIKCDYCFYLEKETQFEHIPWMDDETLEAFVRAYISASGPEVYFTWQGGEPTLAGLEFFRRAVQYQAHHGQGKKIFNALQTNGLLLNEEWCEFLKLHDFLVGISIDGPRELHESYRKTRAGRGTFDKVIAAIEMLKQHEIPFNTLTVVNDINVQHPLRVYEFLKSIGSCHMQFIELLETTEPNVRFCEAPAEAKIVHFSVPAAQYGHFMAELFKAWVTKDVGKIFIRQFESFISRVLGNGHTSCIFQARCQDNFVIESNGDLYECDHFVYPDYKIGNIKRDEISHLHRRC